MIKISSILWGLRQRVIRYLIFVFDYIFKYTSNSTKKTKLPEYV